MTSRYVLESLRFYRVKHENLVRIGFIVLFLLRLIPIVLPYGDRDFTRLNEALLILLSGNLTAIPPVTSLLSPGNWLLLGSVQLIEVLAWIVQFLYAAMYVGEIEGRPFRQSAVSVLRALPRLLLLVAPLLLLAVLSAYLLFIPLIWILTAIYFLPLTLTDSRQPLRDAVSRSFNRSRGHRLTIFVQVLLLMMLVGLPSRLFGQVPGGWTSVLITTFFGTVRTFALGRQMALLYLNVVKNRPDVLPSKPDPAR